MSIKAETSFSLKDQLFNADTVKLLAAHLQRADKKFKADAFRRECLAPFAKLELKERIQQIVTVLHAHLPGDFAAALPILQRALPEPLDPDKTDNDFGQFIWVVPGEYAARYGCSREHLHSALDFLREATKRFSSEGAIRPFLIEFPTETMAFVHDCAKDSNYHVRRLASEGIRPFLPWAPRANVPVADIVPVLEHLYTDPTRYVTRSVANTLNDISKIEPDTVVRVLKGWNRAAPSDELTWVTRHALRSLLKKDNPAAMALLGYPQKPRFSVSAVQASKAVKVGERFSWQCELTAAAAQKLKINLCIYFLKANGSHSAKVFAVKDGQFKAGETLQISKQQPFKPMTTRVLYPGTHHAELTVNGVVAHRHTFELHA